MAVACAACSLTFANPAAAGSDFVPTADRNNTRAYGHSKGDDYGRSPVIVKDDEGDAFNPGGAFSVLDFTIAVYTNKPIFMSGPDDLIDRPQRDENPFTSDQLAAIGTLISFGTELHRAGHDFGLSSSQDREPSRNLSEALRIATGEGFTGDRDDSHSALGAVALPPASDTLRAMFARNPDSAQGLAYSLTITVPEPSTWAMMLFGFFGVGGAIRLARRRTLSLV